MEGNEDIPTADELEKMVGLGKVELDEADKILTAALPEAARTIVHLSQFAESERVRLQAAKHILDIKMLGTTADQPWNRLFAKIASGN